MEILTVIIAVVATVVAAVSLAISIIVFQRQRDAEGRAHFTAEWEGAGSIAYVNHGPGAATEIEVKLDHGEFSVQQSIPYIGALRRMRVAVQQDFGAPSPHQLEVSWKDNRARQTRAIHLPEPPAPKRSHASAGTVEETLRGMARAEAVDAINDDKDFKTYKQRM